MRHMLIVGLAMLLLISPVIAEDVQTVTIHQDGDHFESGEDVSSKLWVTYSNCNDCIQYTINIYEGNKPDEERNVYAQSGQLDETLSIQMVPVTWTAGRSGVYLIEADGQQKSFWVTRNDGHIDTRDVQIQPTPELNSMVLTFVGLLVLVGLAKLGKK